MRVILGWIVVFALRSNAGQIAPPGESNTAIKVDVDLVNVLCNVYDKRGALMNELNREDFEVFENGKKQELRYFARETNLPLTVGLLVDVSGSVRRFIEAEKDAAGQFFQDVLRQDDQALLIGFSSTIVLWQEFTSSLSALRAALTRL